MQRAAVTAARTASAVAQGSGRRHNSVSNGFRDAFGVTKPWLNAKNNKPSMQAYFQKDGIGNPAKPTFMKGSKDSQVQMGMAGLCAVTVGITLYGMVVDMRLGKGKMEE